MFNQNSTTTRKTRIVIPLVIIFSLIVLMSAWLCDDSYITFRVVKNFINGYGLTWNISERVQAYTHPLWMFLVSGFYFITTEIYYTSIIVSMLISIAAILLLLYKLCDSLFSSVIAGLILIFSKAFIDYSTSGLENPLTHLLIVLFFVVYFRRKESTQKFLLLSAIASFATLNRMDIILLFLPALFLTYIKGNRLKGLLILLAGFSPLIIWEVFSLFYYGFPFPNTAYAKLNTGIDRMELIQQGFYYFLFSLYLDPLTPVVIIAGLLLPLVRKDRILFPAASGILLYLIYILIIGGDFMGGRFFSAPLLISVIILAKTDFGSLFFSSKLNKSIVPHWALIAGVLSLGLLSPKPTIFTNANYGLGSKIFKAFRVGPYVANMYHGITDQRMWYYEYSGLLNNIPEKRLYEHLWVKDAFKFKESGEKVRVVGVIGFIGFFSEKDVHIIDPLSLADPLLSKLPSTEYWRLGSKPKPNEQIWLIGHFTRKVPDGYLETIKTGKNQIQDPSLQKYYAKLSYVIKGNLFDAGRISEIWNLNTGKYDYLIENYNQSLIRN